MSSEPTPLPPDRVTDCAPFEIIGIDLAGPLFLKNGGKVWIALFTCAVYRAIHLELVNSLSTDAFLLALRRFVARRGRSRIIYSDNGTNCRGASNDLSKLNWATVLKEAGTEKILWKFIPPTAAWWGGWWERLFRAVKDLRKRTLGKSVLSYEELYTIICDCETIMNCRPLTKEYLSQLVQKHNEKRSREPVVGEIVLMGDDNKKRLFWPLARITELIPGRDGKIRTVKLKTRHGTVIRPIHRIVPLEIQANDRNIIPDKKLGVEEYNSSAGCTIKGGIAPDKMAMQQYSSSGRLVKTPKRLDLLNNVCYELETQPESQGGGKDVVK
ncbi:uncharacterized protein LOC118190078 [Stegodyphus dumicola]|uniref:uncharacterized protein LOC118190078 n=1 Tax=Stegodyphus dumicola TaxID=202533 RepID=UPI0015AA7198|nr:uncharacterized protein LOC118190078 [Stegodyphus dumicola]